MAPVFLPVSPLEGLALRQAEAPPLRPSRPPPPATPNAGTLGDLSGPSLAVTKALHPRIPCYGHLAYDESRLGITSSFQLKPSPDTTITLDALYSDLIANRNE